MKTFRNYILAAFVALVIAPSQTFASDEPLRISTQKRVTSDLEQGAMMIVNNIESWTPSETAIIICDMWDRHWCKGATSRVAEMAPRMNNLINIARNRGVTIVHAPSDCMDYYKNTPQRKEATKYKNAKATKCADGSKLPSEKDAIWPIDQSDEGCDCTPTCEQGGVWKKQIDALEIKDKDLISDSGAELGAYFFKKGIKNVILIGVHTNMCIIGRSFGLRAMERMGMNVVLMRDMTDLMYNHKSAPYVDHFTGLSLMTEYIETYVCPTIVSTDFTGEKQFRFSADKRPIVAFVTAESEYRANQRLPEFAHELLLKNINCEFALGKPIMEGEGRHNIENLQILNDANLAVIFVRRRALEPEKMALIKNYVASKRPLLGIRTASHAFDAKGNVPREGGAIESAKENASEFLEQWPAFDREVLGGNYQGHYGHLKEGTIVTIAPGMESHPLLKGVEDKFTSPNWLYQNRPLSSPNAQVLLQGHNNGVPAEPIFWINNGNIIYTSLGHWDDWKIESFRNLMFNSIDYLLKK